MFELHLTPVQRLFARNELEEPEYNKRYTFFTDTENIVGELVAYDDKTIIIANTWTTDKEGENGHYVDYHVVTVGDIDKINTQQDFEFEIGKPYRAELYIRNEKTDRPTTWVSCYYRGATHSGKIIISIIGKKANVMALNKTDIKGFFQLALDDAQAIEENGDEE